MKHLITFLTVLLIFPLAANAQEKMSGQEKKMPMMDKQKKEQMMGMMQDSTMMNMMMEHIANDNHMRKMMMQKMMQSAKSDTSKLRGMCKMMLENEGMHQMMKKMMKSDMGTMQQKSESMNKQEKGKHEQHHMKQRTKSATESSANEVLVKFKPDTDEAQIKAMASEVGMTQVKELEELNLRVFRISSQKSVQEVIEHCQQEPFVEYAEPNQKYKTQK